MSKMVILAVLACLALSLDPTPPLYNYAFKVSFDETYVINSTQYTVNGGTYYDPAKNRERIDRATGKYNFFCGSIMPNLTTPCVSLAV